MTEIKTRDFERVIEEGINIIFCIHDSQHKSYVPLEQYVQKIPDVNFRLYNVTTNIDAWEMYNMNEFPYVLVFCYNKLINKFPFTTVEDFTKKVNLKQLVKNNKKEEV